MTVEINANFGVYAGLFEHHRLCYARSTLLDTRALKSKMPGLPAYLAAKGLWEVSSTKSAHEFGWDLIEASDILTWSHQGLDFGFNRIAIEAIRAADGPVYVDATPAGVGVIDLLEMAGVQVVSANRERPEEPARSLMFFPDGFTRVLEGLDHGSCRLLLQPELGCNTLLLVSTRDMEGEYWSWRPPRRYWRRTECIPMFSTRMFRVELVGLYGPFTNAGPYLNVYQRRLRKPRKSKKVEVEP